LTLIEMLVALAVTLVMMAAVVNLFANISGSIRNRRAVIEVSGQLRQVRSRLALDLAGATSPGQTWQRPDSDVGYIEIIEGQYNDMFPSELVDGIDTPSSNPPNFELDYATSLVPSAGDPMMDLRATNPPLTENPNPPAPGSITNGRALGDWDDILALTVRSETEPYRAMVGGTMVESPVAEVLWYAFEQPGSTPPNANDGFRRIYRRVLLIAPWLGPWTGSPPDNVSVRYVPASVSEPTPKWVANTLGDLTKRENRAYREFDPTSPDSMFPHPLVRSKLPDVAELVVLSDALAFDVRVYDPGAPLFQAGGTVVQPGDPGWTQAHANWAALPAPQPPPAGAGAYVDLGWNGSALPAGLYTAPSGANVPVFGFNNRRRHIVANSTYYDTWSFHYENDGINQDEDKASDGTIPQPWQAQTFDQGNNGLDDDGINGVDDPGERETGPMYDAPLRGVKVSLRIYERDARQIRETSVTHSFAN
jgi:type II secretory pathway pseudopilin PulG